MSDFDTDMNVRLDPIEPIILIDEISSTEYYIGVSNNGKFRGKAIWKIKKMIKNGTEWDITLFPNGKQSYEFVWDDRTTYTYV